MASQWRTWSALLLACVLPVACGTNGGTPDAGRPGGFYGRCLQEGEMFEAKEGSCCEGLVHLAIAEPGEPGEPDLPPGCVMKAPPSVKVCTLCGNGACGPGENRCNCPADCETGP
jgi:hypothetical protein